MSTSPPPETLRTFAFGELDQGPWGAGWFLGGAGRGLVLVAAPSQPAQALEAELEDTADGAWRINTPVGSLVVTATEAGAELPTPEAGPEGFVEQCTITGELALETGATTSIESTGCRARHHTSLDKVDSVREFSAWFGPREAMALVSVRPRKHTGNEQDAVAAAVIDPEGWPAITDPRLSTTYTSAGDPARVGLELWSDEPDSFPRRLAGESMARRGEGATQGWTVGAHLMVCHSRGKDGPGVYLLARPA
jgi:hypothetical protein